LSLDLPGALRRLKPQKRKTAIRARPDDRLTFVSIPATGGGELLLDTNVYIDVLQARTPDAVKQLLAARALNHSAIAVAELAHAFGRLDPSHPQTGRALKAVEQVIAAIPQHRLHAPSVQALVEANILAGTVARLRGLARTDRQPFVNDAILYLQALEQGHTILTRNLADFDTLQQLVPEGRVLFYR
jgi:predicted nucleic acid-binding protein